MNRIIKKELLKNKYFVWKPLILKLIYYAQKAPSIR